MSATEPAALTALALIAYGEVAAAARPLRWLAEIQQPDGSLGIRAGEDEPRWPTALAVLAWQLTCHKAPQLDPHADERASRATDSLLTLRGLRGEHTSSFVGHDPTLVAWPWVVGTHSWVEPTALSVLALKAMGLNDHPRKGEAIRLLLDRQLPHGGWNYGNTTVLGQELRPHAQPTGTALVALCDERLDQKLDLSIAYLHQAFDQVTAAASLSWIIMGLTAHGEFPAKALDRLEIAYRDVSQRGSPAYATALLALAALGKKNPLLQRFKTTTADRQPLTIS